jgi:cobalt-zinc-cadmium efflux system protein
MAHDHSHHGHHHHHDHSVQLTNVNAAFIIGIILNLSFVIIEVIYGLSIHSLSLLSDAGHNFADVAALALSLLAFRLMKVKSNENFTYGYKKTSVLVALFNAAVLLASVTLIIYQSIHRLMHPEPLPGKTVAIIAAIGIAVNGISAFLFLKNKEKDLNVKGAYLHLLSDAVVSFGIVVGGIIIFYTNWFWLDAAIGILIGIVILFSTFNLFKNSLRLSLDGVPENIHLEKIKAAAQKISGVKELHHIHVWAMSTTENAMTAHLVLEENISTEDEQKIKAKLKHELLHQNITHTTLETERENQPCAEENCAEETVSK